MRVAAFIQVPTLIREILADLENHAGRGIS